MRCTVLLSLVFFLVIGCTKDVGLQSYSQSGYPDVVGRIIVRKCATSGCHNANNYETNSVVKTIYAGHQPYAIEVNESTGMVVVANRNLSPGGPKPQHSSNCEGQNGYVNRN